MDTLLFDSKKVEKFFNILKKMGRMNSDKYKEIYPSCSCEKDVFIKRTVSKWFEGKYIILFSNNEDIVFKEYLYISRISFSYGYSDGIDVMSLNFNRPDKMGDRRTLRHNDFIYMEGRFCEDGTTHIQVFGLLTTQNEPIKEYTFEGYDMGIYNKVRKNKEERSRKEFTVSAKTYHEASKLIDELSKNNPNLMIKY